MSKLKFLSRGVRVRGEELREMKYTSFPPVSFQYSSARPHRLFWKVAGRSTFERADGWGRHAVKKRIHYQDIETR